MSYKVPKKYDDLLSYIITGHAIREKLNTCPLNDTVTIQFINEPEEYVQKWKLVSDSRNVDSSSNITAAEEGGV